MTDARRDQRCRDDPDQREPSTVAVDLEEKRERRSGEGQRPSHEKAQDENCDRRALEGRDGGLAELDVEKREVGGEKNGKENDIVT